MKTNLKTKESLQLKKKALALLSKAIAKIILKFRLPRNEFISSLDENLVLQAKVQDPEASNVAIAIRTGIDRRYIARYLKGDIPITKPDKLVVILEDIRWTAHKFYNSTKIPKTGPFRSFQSICEQRASGTLTYKAILEELVKNGHLLDLGKEVRILNFKTKLLMDDINSSQLTATQINRVVDTIIYNSETTDSLNKYVQRTVYSTQINPIEFPNLHKDIKLKVEKFNAEITNLLISYEDNTNVGTYPEYGVSFLEYKIEN